MKKRAISVLGLVFVSAVVVTHAQWLNYPTPGVPRTPDGKPKLDAPDWHSAQMRLEHPHRLSRSRVDGATER